MSKTTWRKELMDYCAEFGENFDDLIIAIEDGGLDKEFDNGYGLVEGPPFTAWSKDRVYFPSCYDGAEMAVYVSRNPDGQATDHIGGGG